MKTATISLTLFLLISSTFISHNHLYRLHRINKDQSFSQTALIPGTVAKLIALEFRGFAADYLFLQTIAYLGGKLITQKSINKSQYHLIYKALDQMTYLDQRFLDPYVLAQTTLPWEAGMVRETNELLKKNIEVRTNDYRPYLFLWYNHFYLLQDPTTAAQYLKMAAKIPGTPNYFSSLAARSSYYGGDTAAAILFLNEVIGETHSLKQKKYLQVRLEALKRIYFIEQKLITFKEKYGSYPETLGELIDKGIIKKIPDDPYGGKFYIVSEGQVYSTSKLVFLPQKPTNKEKESDKGK